MQNTKRKVVGYCRVSTARQVEEKTIDTQVEMIESYCVNQGWELVAIRRDEGVGGTIPFSERSGGKQVINDIKSNGVEAVVVYHTNRLWRSSLVQARFIEEIYHDLETDLVSISDPADMSSPSGELMVNISGAMASYERKAFLQRSQDATERLVREGVWMGGIVPYGYRATGEKKQCFLAVDDEKMECGFSPRQVVEMIFDLCANKKWSSGQIAEHLNSLGILPHYARDERLVKRPKGVRRELTRAVWRDARVQAVLHNTIYHGVHHWGKRTSKKAKRPSRREARALISRSMPAIVSKEIWEEAQRTLTKNRSLSTRNSKRRYLLRGQMKCVHCGLTLVGAVSNASKIENLQKRGEIIPADAEIRDGHLLRSYYICTGKNNARSLNAKPCKRCDSKSLRADDIEELLWSDVEEFLRNPQETLTELEGRLSQASSEYPVLEERAALERRLAQLESERQNAITLYTRGIITESDLQIQLQQQGDTISAINTKMAQAINVEQEQAQSRALVGTAKGLLEQINVNLDAGLDFETRAKIMSLLLADVQVETTIVPPPTGKVKPSKQAKVTATYQFWPSTSRVAPPVTTTEHGEDVRAATYWAE